jgi:CelD/BcsL family acetyltransferase involved in cellulose biosynthesis
VFPAGPKVMCGLFPLVRRRSFYGLPVRTWELWRHRHCFLGTPLVRRDCAREVLDFFFQTAATRADGAAVVHLPTITADGPLARVLVESNHDARRAVFVKDHFTRALFRSAVDAETFLKSGLSRKKRQGIQRTERRLAESGSLTTQWYDGGDLRPWIDGFLHLEESGWKGEGRTALRSSAADADFFCEMLQSTAATGELMIGRLAFNGLPIAMICNLLAREGGYSFKIAYDESFAEHSPGLLLELAMIRELHERGIAWMDSCAAADHPMINHLWPDRTIRQSLVVSTGRGGGDLAVSLMPLVRWAKGRRSTIVSQKRTS